MPLTKTDFIHYLNCRHSLWLQKNEPESFTAGEMSAFLLKLVEDGSVVERYVRQLFETIYPGQCAFQVVFDDSGGMYARADVWRNGGSDGCHLYEVKSSTSVKRDAQHDHIKDACFQLIAAERDGFRVNSISIIHLNGAYVRSGPIDVNDLLTIADVTDEVRGVEAETLREIEGALAWLERQDIDRMGCGCRFKSRANHCDAFTYFNRDIPKPSIYSLPRLVERKRRDLLDLGVLSLHDIPGDFALSPSQHALVAATQAGAPVINHRALAEFLDRLVYPLYFFDYETYASAIPIIDTLSPYAHLPVQYSLHVLHEDGSLEHREFLEEEKLPPKRLIEALKDHIGDTGNLVSWHASFEKTRNRDMAKNYPEHAAFLESLNERTVDLEDLFKTAYVDAAFDGYTSIKKVLPVLCPDLSYADLAVRDGTGAMEAWSRLVDPATPQEELHRISEDLRAYCHLDTLAMVRIFQFIQTLITTR